MFRRASVSRLSRSLNVYVVNKCLDVGGLCEIVLSGGPEAARRPPFGYLARLGGNVGVKLGLQQRKVMIAGIDATRNKKIHFPPCRVALRLLSTVNDRKVIPCVRVGRSIILRH